MNLNKYIEKRNKCYSKYAYLDKYATREKRDTIDIRTPFFRDIDRIIYSQAYLRTIDKTQVFTFSGQDHIIRRMTHVQYVSKIARTIGRCLGLNEDLIEAAALGHDLGHTPFGHIGEAILNKISIEANEGYFNHNVQSVRILKYIENDGSGLNITTEVLDAIMCHNGEIICNEYKPKKKSIEEFNQSYLSTYTNKKVELVPYTLEGCVVRLSDFIAYVGKDLEDAILMNVITYDDIPKDIRKILGNNNKEIINTIILDILKNSIDKDYIKMSDNIYNAVNKLKKYNYENIYAKSYSSINKDILEEKFRELYNYYLNNLKNCNKKTIIYKYYDKMSESYKNNSYERIVIDFLAGMTDTFFMKEYKKISNK